ncbi:MAG: transposase [Pseudomonadota bacterium]
MLQAERHATGHLALLTPHIETILPEWDLAPTVRSLQALRGVALISAVTFITEIGNVRRFESPVKQMAYLGWCQANTQRVRPRAVVGSHALVTRGSGTNWSKALGPIVIRPGAKKLYLLQELPSEVQGIAWRAQSRL